MKRWFKLHADLRLDHRVQSLTDKQFRLYINLLCYACSKDKNGRVGDVENIIFQLQTRKDVVKKFIRSLEDLNLIATSGAEYFIPQWDKKQYNTGLSTERVREHRRVNRNDTETDTDSDTEKKKNKKRNGEGGPVEISVPETLPLALPDDPGWCAAIQLLIESGYTRSKLATYFSPGGHSLLRRAGDLFVVQALSATHADLVEQRLGAAFNEIIGKGNWKVQLPEQKAA